MVERALDRHERILGRSGNGSLRVLEARLLLIWIAFWIASTDLVVKLVEPTEPGLYHRRTTFELLVILAISAATIYFVPLARSLPVAVGAGFMVGGGIGNALSIAVFSPGVPNPFTFSRGDWTIAFNLADLGVAIGFLLMATGIWSLTRERRQELREPVER